MRDQRVYERITGSEGHGPSSVHSLPAFPLEAAVMTVPAGVVRPGWDTEPESVGSLKAKRPSGGARLPRGPDRCGRTPTVANWTWASSPARIMQPPPHLPGNRRGGRSLPQAPQSCQEPVGSSGRSDRPTGSFDGRPSGGLTRHRGKAGRRPPALRPFPWPAFPTEGRGELLRLCGAIHTESSSLAGLFRGQPARVRPYCCESW